MSAVPTTDILLVLAVKAVPEYGSVSAVFALGKIRYFYAQVGTESIRAMFCNKNCAA